MLKRLSVYLSFAASAIRYLPCRLHWPARCLQHRAHPVTWSKVAWILVAMVAARSAAMGFNRLVTRD